MNSSFEDVDAFSSLWYNFDSRRELSHSDDKGKAGCHGEWGWTARKNRATRAHMKKRGNEQDQSIS